MLRAASHRAIMFFVISFFGGASGCFVLQYVESRLAYLRFERQLDENDAKDRQEFAAKSDLSASLPWHELYKKAAEISREKREAERKANALELGLPLDATWDSIADEDDRRMMAKDFKIPSVTKQDIAFIRYLLSKSGDVSGAVGLEENASWDSIQAAQEVRRKALAKLFALGEDATLQQLAEELNKRSPPEAK